MRLTGDKNQCPTCGEFFNSSFAFDKHRTGPFGRNDPDTGEYLAAARRCKTVEQMKATGMEKNAAGFWVTERMPIRMHHEHR